MLYNNIYVVNCKDKDDVKKVIAFLIEKFKQEKSKFTFREISETFLLANEKWIVAPAPIVKMITKRKNNFILINSQDLK